MNYFNNYHIVNDNGKNQRAKIRWLQRVELEEAVVWHVIADLTSPVFIRALLKEKPARCRTHCRWIQCGPLRERVAETSRQVTRAMTLAVQLENPAPALRMVDDLEKGTHRHHCGDCPTGTGAGAATNLGTDERNRYPPLPQWTGGNAGTDGSRKR